MTIDKTVNYGGLPAFITDPDFCHITLKEHPACQSCQTRVCLTICPSAVFRLKSNDNQVIEINYQQCIECGACRLVCPQDNIKFTYPHGGFGVQFNDGSPLP